MPSLAHTFRKEPLPTDTIVAIDVLELRVQRTCFKSCIYDLIPTTSLYYRWQLLVVTSEYHYVYTTPVGLPSNDRQTLLYVFDYLPVHVHSFVPDEDASLYDTLLKLLGELFAR